MYLAFDPWSKANEKKACRTKMFISKHLTLAVTGRATGKGLNYFNFIIFVL